LSCLREGQEGVVVDIEAPGIANVLRRGWGARFLGRGFGWRWRWGRRGGYGAIKRLADLGIVVGSRVKVVRRAPLGGPIEVEVAGSRFIIGRGLADAVIVEV